MQWIIRAIDSINEWVGRILCWLLIPLVCITAYEVFMRYVMKQPTIWAWDLNIMIFAAITFLGGGYALLTKGHVTVDVFTLNLAPKKRAILDIVTSSVFFFGLTVLMIKGFDIFMMSYSVKETFPTIWAPPYYPMKFLLPLGCFLLLLQGISELLKNVTIVLGKNNGKTGV
ncbi:MAG TPA: TRAP transporter small permease subunit [Deltaproteobacteria bacterium]|nr:TRAP transporter small permease subunit [Deltaproteobacteria bacterium]